MHVRVGPFSARIYYDTNRERRASCSARGAPTAVCLAVKLLGLLLRHGNGRLNQGVRRGLAQQRRGPYGNMVGCQLLHVHCPHIRAPGLAVLAGGDAAREQRICGRGAGCNAHHLELRTRQARAMLHARNIGYVLATILRVPSCWIYKGQLLDL